MVFYALFVIDRILMNQAFDFTFAKTFSCFLKGFELCIFSNVLLQKYNPLSAMIVNSPFSGLV